MSGSDPSGPNWSAVFDRAHRRIIARILIVAAVGAIGALLLLSGGLAASGTISIPILAKNKNGDEKSNGRGKGKGKGPKENPGKHPPGETKHPGGRPHQPGQKGQHPKNPGGEKPDCRDKEALEDSSSTEYEDCLDSYDGEGGRSDKGGTSGEGGSEVETGPKAAGSTSPDE